MARDPHPSSQPERPEVHLLEITIYLFNPSTDPSLINPDFLRYNEIVETSWPLIRPVMMDASSSRIRYANGLSLFADADQISISQRVATDPEGTTIIPLIPNDLMCFKVAKQYLQSVSPALPYESISIDPTSLIEIPAWDSNNYSSPLQNLGSANSLPRSGT